MERALYDPNQGYYASGRVRIGKKGDFFTNVSIGKVYGKMVTLFTEELWERMGRPDRFSIVEQGADDGRLALDILEGAASSPDFFKAIDYYIVEPFSLNRKRQEEKLKHQQQISWVERLEELPTFQGIHFSNELLDAFPVHLLLWNGEEWLEQRVVATEEGKHGWISTPIEQEELHAVAQQLPRNLESPFLWEVRLGIEPWLQAIGQRMRRGAILIADYGYAGEDRFAPYRAQGSIACYHNHRRYNNPLEEVGKRDISAHVDFTDLAQKALRNGFEILGYSDQHHFLVGAAEKWLQRFEREPLTPTKQKELRSLQTLLHPEGMGRSFKLLLLGKGIPSAPPLGGFRYQRPGVGYLFGS
jgi:SAM-dependent MidA family methyltransferase